MEKRPFFRAATAGLGKYHTGGYGRIGVYRVKDRQQSIWPILVWSQYIGDWYVPPNVLYTYYIPLIS